MRRREFITLCSGAAAAWPLAARAQQPGKVPRIGFLGMSSPSTFAPRLEGIRLGLRDFGYIEGAAALSEQSEGHLEKFFSPSRCESDSLTAMGHGGMERASHGADGLFRC